MSVDWASSNQEANAKGTVMQRDWDVIREILVRLDEKGAEKHDLRVRDFGEDRRDIIAYHVEILEEEGLIDARMSKSLSSPVDFFAMRLTFEGHELLDAIRNDTVWRKTKENFAAKGVSMTLDLVKQIALKFATELMTRA